MTEEEFKSHPTAGAGHETPPQVPLKRPADSLPAHDSLAADWPAPKRTRPTKPKVRVRHDQPRFLPDTRQWGTRQWLTAAALVTLLALTVVAVAYDPSIAPRWVEALFGKAAGMFGA